MSTVGRPRRRQWAITGDLTIKGTTNSVTIDFEEVGSAQDPFGNVRIGFEGATTVNRKDWGLTWNAALETGGVLVSEKIKLEFDISAIKQRLSRSPDLSRNPSQAGRARGWLHSHSERPAAPAGLTARPLTMRRRAAPSTT